MDGIHACIHTYVHACMQSIHPRTRAHTHTHRHTSTSHTYARVRAELAVEANGAGVDWCPLCRRWSMFDAMCAQSFVACENLSRG